MASRSVLSSSDEPAGIMGDRPQEPSRTAFLEPPWHSRVKALEAEVLSQGACVLSGNTLKIDEFERLGPEIVQAGLVSQADVNYVLNGIRNGFDLGVDEKKLPGKRIHRNYKSAYEKADLVSEALRKRVAKGKTLKLGKFSGDANELPGTSGIIVPNGSVAKKLEPDAVRPFSDHTKTGFNAACDMSAVEHSLDTYSEIADELKPGYFMRIEDVDGAFPILPLHPSVWKYMYVWWFDVDRPLSEQTGPNTLYMHVFADFGTGPLPGIWDKFWKVCKAMATVTGALTLPMPHFVDDNSVIGPDEAEVNKVAEAVGKYLASIGVPFKHLKSRAAASKQLVLGFWWDSVERTRTLEEHKVKMYLEYMRQIAGQRTVTLLELQVLSGRVQRATMTMPPGATVYLASVLALMAGLKLPWHKRRLTREAKLDIRLLIQVLESNLGRGYFSHTHFEWAPAVYTDASKESRFAGGGFISADGFYDFWEYGSADRHKHIHTLEGDAVLRAARALAPLWSSKRVPFFIDNSAFQLSFKKGRSKSPELNGLLRELFLISVQHNCLFVPQWISTHDNIAADALSRADLPRFFESAHLFSSAGQRLRRCSEC